MIEYPIAVVRAKVARRRELEAQLDALAAVLGARRGEVLATAQRWRGALEAAREFIAADERMTEPLDGRRYDQRAMDWETKRLALVESVAALGQAAGEGDR